MLRRDVFQAIADPVRRDIIGLLAEETSTINTIAEQFDVSRPAISKHLKILEECGIIVIHKEGRERYCRIQPATLIPAFMWMDQYRELWEEKLDSFENYLKKLKTNLPDEQAKNKDHE
ncbi:MAG: DNA-binding transcriptional ArsR family regulator [Cyclobacteriaceae bacterium]|jgi:DNA-binding transcriptional ArsR family regulator